MLFQLSFDTFFKKVMLWNINEQSLTKVLYEKIGNNYVFYLPTPEMNYCATISEQEFTPVQRHNLLPISIPAHLIKNEVKIDRESIEALKQNEPKIVVEKNIVVEDAES